MNYRYTIKPGTYSTTLRWQADFMITKLAVSIVIAALIMMTSDAANAESDGTPDELWELYEDRMDQRRTTEWVLFGWGSANIAGGSILLLTGHQNFGGMSLAWGAINMAIVTPSLFISPRPEAGQKPFSETVREELRYQRIVAINSSLNVSYILAGAGMMHYGESSRIREFGSAVIIQGAFLLLYDLVLLRHSSRYLDRLTGKTQWTAEPSMSALSVGDSVVPGFSLRINI